MDLQLNYPSQDQMTKHQTVRVLIIDDEPIARDIIRKLLSELDYVKVVSESTNGKDALEAIMEYKPDLVFLDIEMPDMNGFEVLKALNPAEIPLVIFTTAFDQYAIKAFEANALDYLLKPFDKERFMNSFEKAVHRFELLESSSLSTKIGAFLKDFEGFSPASDQHYLDKITVRHKNKIRLIKVEQIDWIEASGDYICIHTEGEKYLINDSMNQIAKKLDPKSFMRIHRSTIVNIEEIHEIEPYFNGEYFMHLKDKTKLKSSRSYKESILRLIK